MIEQEMIKKVQIAKADIDIRGDGYGKIVIIVAKGKYKHVTINDLTVRLDDARDNDSKSVQNMVK